MAEFTLTSGSGKTTKLVNRKEEEKKKRKPSQLDLDLSHKSEALKPIPKDLLTKFFREGFAEICNVAKIDVSHIKMNDQTHVLNIFTTNRTQGEKIIEAMMHKVAYELGNFLEKETGEDRRTFYRSVTLFESSVEENQVSIRWA